MKKLMRDRIKTFSILLLTLTMLLNGCGSANYESAAPAEEMYGGYAQNDVYAKAAPAAEEAAAESYDLTEESAGTVEAEMGDGGSGVSDGALQQETIEKKLIKNVDLEVETQEFDALIENLTAQVEAMGGYVENFYTSGNAMHDIRNAGLTLRVPCDELDAFLGKVAEQSNVLYRNESVRDVTLEYVDMDTHKKVLLTERDRLLELLEQAETVEDLITIESRLSEVRYQIESTEAQLRAIDNQVSYSTVYINIQEVKVYTPVADKSVWEEIVEGFGNNVYRVFEMLGEFLVELIIGLPFIIFWIAAIAILVLVFKLLGKLRKKRKQKKELRKAQKKGMEADFVEIPAVEEKKDE